MHLSKTDTVLFAIVYRVLKSRVSSHVFQKELMATDEALQEHLTEDEIEGKAIVGTTVQDPRPGQVRVQSVPRAI
jgi:hypothetical protein